MRLFVGCGVGAWDAGQVRMFAKQVAEKYRAAWFVLATEVRDAIISHHVLMIFFSQRDLATVDDVRELRTLIEQRLADHHNMKAAS